MSGVDLSQSMEQKSEEKKRGWFDLGTILSVITLVVTVSAFGGLRFYLHSLDKKIAALDEAIAANGKQLTGERVNRVADFSARVSLLGTDSAESTNPQDILTALEQAMVSGVTLSEYEYNEELHVVTIGGRAESFRKVAEQITSLKSLANFPEVKVELIDRDEESQIIFRLKAYPQ